MGMRQKIILLLALLLVSLSSYSQFKNLKIENGVSPKNDIVSINFDFQNNLWLGTSYGVYQYVNKQWTPIGIEDVYIHSLHITPKDEVWAGAWGGGAHKLFNGQWVKSEEATSGSLAINDIITDKKGNIWFATWNKGITMFDSKKWTNFHRENSNLADNSVISLGLDNKGNVWAGTYRGLSVYDGKSWKSFTRDNSDLPNNDVYALAKAKSNRMWVGTCGGLVLLDSNRVYHVFNTYNSSIPSNTILTVLEDESGNVWIGTNKGLTKYDGTNWFTYTMENSNILEDHVQTLKIYNNKLYIGTSLGLSILELTK